MTSSPASRLPWSVFDIAGKEKEIDELHRQSSAPDLWLDRNNAQGVMRQLAEKTRAVQRWRGLEKKLADIAELLEISKNDTALQAEIEKELKEVSDQLAGFEFQLAFKGEFDSRNAILAIHAGAGGTESQDWAEMLMRLYLRWAERRGFKTEILDTSPGDEA